MITITGNTFPHKSIIKTLGFKWNPKFKSWDRGYNISQEEIDKLSALNGLIVDESWDSGKSVTHVDNRTYKQQYGRCEDAPCCGCCGQY